MGEEPESVGIQRGLTSRAILALIYGCVVLQPAAIFVSLTSGLGLAGAAWLVILLFSELAIFYGKPLSKQEMFIIYSFEAMVASQATIFITFIRALYFRTSPITSMFGLTELLPNWFAPPLSSPIVTQGLRTFVNHDWVYPITVSFLSSILALAASASLGYLCFQIYSEVEQLPFPLQNVVVEGISTIAVRDKKRTRLLTSCAMIGATYSMILYIVPPLTGGMRIIPVPYVDLNSYVGWILPGASFGVATDIISFVTGFVVPFNVATCMFVGSMATQFIGNALAIHFYKIFKLEDLKTWYLEWKPGMSISLCHQRSILNLWTSALVGLAFAAGLMPLMRHPEYLVRAFRKLAGIRVGGRGSFFWIVMGMFLASSVAYAGLISWLAPAFPFWILIVFLIGWVFLLANINTRSIGMTGYQIEIPFIKESLIVGSGYDGLDIWFAPISTGNAPIWAASYRVAKMLELRISDYLKAYIISFILGTVMSFVYVSMFWAASPIPSATYPWTMVYWPFDIMWSSLWTKIWWTRALEIFKPLQFFGSFAIAAILFIIGEVARIPISLIGLSAGTFSFIPFNVSIFIGALIGRYIRHKFFGDEWKRYAPVLVAGFGIGSGIVMAISAAISMVVGGMWSVPY